MLQNDFFRQHNNLVNSSLMLLVLFILLMSLNLGLYLSSLYGGSNKKAVVIENEFVIIKDKRIEVKVDKIKSCKYKVTARIINE